MFLANCVISLCTHCLGTSAKLVKMYSRYVDNGRPLRACSRDRVCQKILKQQALVKQLVYIRRFSCSV